MMWAPTSLPFSEDLSQVIGGSQTGRAGADDQDVDIQNFAFRHEL